MSRTKLNILIALFDIKPVDETGRIDLHKITNIAPVINLVKSPIKQNQFKHSLPVWPGNQKSAGKVSKKTLTDTTSTKLIDSIGTTCSTLVQVRQPEDGKGFTPLGSWLMSPNRHHTSLTAVPTYQEKLISQDELEKCLNANLDTKKEIKNVGGAMVPPIFAWQKSGISSFRSVAKMAMARRRQRPTSNQTPNPDDQVTDQDDYQTILSQINRRILPEVGDLFTGEPRKMTPFECWNGRLLPTSTEFLDEPQRFSESSSSEPSLTKSQILKLKNWKSIIVISFMAVAVGFLGKYGVNIKNEIVQESNSAVASLEEAGKNLKVFDFEAASNSFAESYEKFSKAGDNLNFMGASLTSLFAELPGAGKLKSAKNLVEAGKLLAEAGKSMSEAVGYFSETVLILNVEDISPRGFTISNLKKSLLVSSRNLSNVSTLLSDINTNVLPEDKKETFLEFQSKLPEFEKLISDVTGYTDFLEEFLGFRETQPSLSAMAGKAKKYLVLFQNNSELRPTGGFPGTYAIITFKDGKLSDFLVDDVYNLDGQLKEDIIPPAALQHITPTWGMRDTNWFIDFSVSAQKIMEFFKKEAGYEVDGVITISPQIVSNILKVVGPIEMTEYDAVVNDENFVLTIQEEIEYGDNRQQPKKIVIDMAPKLLEKINSADPNQWLEIFKVVMSGLDKKDILMYFRDLSLENFVAEKEFGGLIKKTDNDYLMIIFSNIKGSKTDAVTDNSIKIDTRFEKNLPRPGSASKVIHKLELTRQHNGGSNKYGFYNKQNPAYVRVLVPEGSELLSISGNANPEFKPLISYSDGNFKKDEDLFKLESSFRFDGKSGVSTYRESDKVGFTFWLITDPGKKETVELEYSVPLNLELGEYNMYIQKQPGMEVDNFEFQAGNDYLYNGEFDKDLELRFKIP